MKHMNEYEKQARDFLKNHGAKMTICYRDTVQGFPFDKTDKNFHDKYTVTIRRGGKSYSFPFYNSAYSTERNERPTAYDVLACIEKYEPYGDVWDFASEYGYTIEDRESFQRVERIFKACQTQARKINRLFADCMVELCEIA